MGYTINERKYDYDSMTNQNIKKEFVSRHVYVNVSSMVEYILSKSFEDLHTPFSDEDITNYYLPICPECGENHVFEEKTEVCKCCDCGEIFFIEPKYCPVCTDTWSENENAFDELDVVYMCQHCGHIVEDIDELRTEPQEIYGWWMISDFLARKLKEKGECIIEGEGIWGRTCCGQAILLDSVISEICYEMEILEDQKYSCEGK